MNLNLSSEYLRKRVFYDPETGEFGGDGRSIEAPAAFGVSMGAIQELANKVDRLERRIS